MAKKQTCDNCYNYISGQGIFRMLECLRHNPDQGEDFTEQMEANGKGCAEWQPKTIFKRYGRSAYLS